MFLSLSYIIGMQDSRRVRESRERVCASIVARHIISDPCQYRKSKFAKATCYIPSLSLVLHSCIWLAVNMGEKTYVGMLADSDQRWLDTVG